MALAVDTIAGRIRALECLAPASYSAFARLTTVNDPADGVPKALEMVRLLVEGHETAVGTARRTLSVADEVYDQATVDLANQRLQVHEKAAWMLRSMLEE